MSAINLGKIHTLAFKISYLQDVITYRQTDPTGYIIFA